MYTLFKKEISGFFSSLTGYIVIIVFLIINGLFMWIFPGVNNVLDSGYASLDSLFSIAPWVFLFLAPAVTMRMFSDEKKTGTIELLLTRPLSDFQIIFAKFMAALFGVLFMLSLTVLFPTILAVSGYSDWGSVSASYAGLIFSIMCYLSVGLFTSSLTDNQIIAAISGFCILLLMMLMVLTANATDNFIIGQIFQYLSIAAHYEGFVRGTIKSYDLIYYASFVGFAFFLTNKSLDSRNW